MSGHFLEMLGLDRRTEAVYREMLADPTGGVAELAGALGMTEGEVREGLDQLADLRLVRTSRERPGALLPVSPEHGLEVILRRQEEELLRRQQELALGKAAAARVVAEYGSSRASGDVPGAERLVGLDAIQAKLEVLAAGVTRSCLSVMPGGAQSPSSLEASRPLDERALGRGVELRTLYQDSARNDAATHAYAQWMTGLGGAVRTSPVLPPRLLIVDDEVAVVPIDPADSRQGALCTREPGIVAALVSLFEQAWEMAVPLGAGQRKSADGGLSAAERELLKLLASGMTDEAAGKRLGVSMRTVRRQMAVMMERLEASSRFEAGLKAARRGWL